MWPFIEKWADFRRFALSHTWTQELSSNSRLAQPSTFEAVPAQMARTINILHLIDHMGLGGAQTVLGTILKLRNDNIKQHAYALRKTEDQMDVDHLIVCNSHRRYSPRPIIDTIKIIEKELISVLHCHLFRSQVCGFLIKQLYYPNIKLIFHEHGQILKHSLFSDTFMKFARKDVDCFIAVSREVRNKLVERCKINALKIRIMHNFIDTLRFRPQTCFNKQKERAILGINIDETAIGFVGRLNHVKGCDLLVRSLKHDASRKVKLLVAGVGPLEKKLRRLAVDLGLEKRVIFLGFVKNMSRYYGIIDLLVLPSRSESFGLAILEAQASGLPVIARNLPAVREIAQETCLFFDHEAEIIGKVSLLVNDEAMKNELIRSGLENVRRFCVNSYFDQLKMTFDELFTSSVANQ